MRLLFILVAVTAFQLGLPFLGGFIYATGGGLVPALLLASVPVIVGFMFEWMRQST